MAFLIGNRIQLHPATDRWMMGDRYGIVEATAKGCYLVRLDVSGQYMWIDERDLLEVQT